MAYTREQIQKAVESKGYKWFEGGNYNLNIVGIRNSDTNNEVTNKFDDLLTVSYSVDGEIKYHEFTATTDPGQHWEKNLLNKDGVAILVPNQYRGSHEIRKHQGKYEALCQKKPVKVYRDNNKDGKYDMLEENIQEGIFGINIHKAGSRVNGSTQIDKWSAGCQVFSKESDFNQLMDLAYKAKDLYGNSFTYTLIESKDIV
jgi:hypothetical protein